MKPHHGRRGDPVWLADALRHWGVRVHERPGWLNWGQGDFDDITHVVAHHTAGPNTSADFIARNPMLGNGLSSQIHLGRDGLATMCGVGIAWHAGQGEWSAPPELRGNVSRNTATGWRSFTAANARSIGIEAVNAGDGSQVWPAVQMDAYKRVCAAICWYLGLPASHVVGHKEVTPSQKIDPNFDMHAFRRDVQHLLDNPPVPPIPEEGFLMALSDAEQRELLDKTRRIHHELTYGFQSRYVDPETGEQSTFTETLVGYALEADRKLETMRVQNEKES